MRAIDADAIEYTHAVARNLFDGHNWNELVVTKDEIEDMPTIQPVITHEQAVAYLQSTGWMQEHDRQMMLDGVHRLTAQPEPHWIPCSEGLPKEEGFYLVTLEDKCGAETTIRFFRIENGERHWSLWGNENITAWMPKPEPYKGVTE